VHCCIFSWCAPQNCACATGWVAAVQARACKHWWEQPATSLPKRSFVHLTSKTAATRRIVPRHADAIAAATVRCTCAFQQVRHARTYVLRSCVCVHFASVCVHHRRSASCRLLSSAHPLAPPSLVHRACSARAMRSTFCIVAGLSAPLQAPSARTCA
jgi:hypothetical protein